MAMVLRHDREGLNLILAGEYGYTKAEDLLKKRTHSRSFPLRRLHATLGVLGDAGQCADKVGVVYSRPRQPLREAIETSLSSVPQGCLRVTSKSGPATRGNRELRIA